MIYLKGFIRTKVNITLKIFYSKLCLYLNYSIKNSYCLLNAKNLSTFVSNFKIFKKFSIYLGILEKLS